MSLDLTGAERAAATAAPKVGRTLAQRWCVCVFYMVRAKVGGRFAVSETPKTACDIDIGVRMEVQKLLLLITINQFLHIDTWKHGRSFRPFPDSFANRSCLAARSTIRLFRVFFT